MVKQIDLAVDKGFTFTDNNELTLDFSSDLIEKRPSGLYVPSLKGVSGVAGKSTPDNHTVVKDNSSGYIKTNSSVVEYIFTMCAYKVTNRGSSTSDYQVDTTQIKTPNEIVNELNAEMDANNNYNCTSYIMQQNNLFALRNTVHVSKPSNWPVPIDEGNRFPGDVLLALFVVDGITHPTSKYLYTKSLTIKCLYSTLSAYVKGQTYTGTGKLSIS